MGKVKGFALNRKQYDRVRKMDHGQMTLWAESIYKIGFKDGSSAAEGLTVGEMKAVILEIKGIGEKKANDIVQALTQAQAERKMLTDG